MLSHFHNHHGYPVLTCVDPQHSDGSCEHLLELPNDIYFVEDVADMLVYMGEALVTVALQEHCRKKNEREAWLKYLYEEYGRDP